MSTRRRGRGEGGLYFDESRQRWIATASLGFDPAGRRVKKRASGRTKSQARDKLRELLRDHADGLAIAPTDYRVRDAVNDWLGYGLAGRDAATVAKNRSLCTNHVLPALGSRRLRDLTADDVDRWLAQKASTHSTSTVASMRGALDRAIRRAMARDKVKRNVVALTEIPTGQVGRPSKSLSLAQAEAVLACVEASPMRGYIVLGLLTGARTEELRALLWEDVDLVGRPDAVPVVPPHIAVWRSVRNGGDTKTRKSRRTLALPTRCIEALEWQRAHQDADRAKAADRWVEHGLVFASSVGTQRDAADTRRAFRAAIAGVPGLDPTQWTPRELRHSFVSLLSDSGLPLEEISRLVGHRSTTVTELVYRKQLRPVVQSGAVAMDGIFGARRGDSDPQLDPHHRVGEARGRDHDAAITR
jgi:integrase